MQDADAYPLGSMLSGGLDSSSIACTARKLMVEGKGYSENAESKLHTFSAVFENVSASDESFYIDSVLRKGNFEPHFLIADKISPFGRSGKDHLASGRSDPSRQLVHKLESLQGREIKGR